MPWIEFERDGEFIEEDIHEEELEFMRTTCMCGDPVGDHGWGHGHSPVDQYSYWRYPKYNGGKDAMD